MDPINTIVPAMNSSCEIVIQHLEPPKPESETWEQTYSLVVSSTSSNRPMSILTESKPLVITKEVVKDEFQLFSAANNHLDDAIESITASVEQLDAESQKCIAPLVQIKKILQTLPKFPSLTNATDQNLLQKLKLLTAPSEFIIAEKKRINSLAVVIKESLYTINVNLHLFSSAEKEKLLSPYSSIKKFCSEEHLEKYLSKDISESVFMYLPASADGDLFDAIRFLNASIEQILAEQKLQTLHFTKIQSLFEFILKQI